MAFPTERSPMKLSASPVNAVTGVCGRSQGGVFSSGFPDARGAAASRLLFRFTLDPLSGFTAVNPILSVVRPVLFTAVHL